MNWHANLTNSPAPPVATAPGFSAPESFGALLGSLSRALTSSSACWRSSFTALSGSLTGHSPFRFGLCRSFLLGVLACVALLKARGVPRSSASAHARFRVVAALRSGSALSFGSVALAARSLGSVACGPCSRVARCRSSLTQKAWLGARSTRSLGSAQALCSVPGFGSPGSPLPGSSQKAVRFSSAGHAFLALLFGGFAQLLPWVCFGVAQALLSSAR